jgi:hypothetical protein
MRPQNGSALVEVDKNVLEPVVQKAFEELTSTIANKADWPALNDFGKPATYIKYATMIMDYMVPQGRRALGEVRIVAPPAGPATIARLDNLPSHASGGEGGPVDNAMLKQVYDMLCTFSLKEGLKGATEFAATGDTAEIIKIPTNHACLYTAMQVVAVAAANGAHAVKQGKDTEFTAKSTVLLEARREYAVDATLFVQRYEMDFDDYHKKMLEPPSTCNWGGEPEMILFTKHHPELEIRVINVDQGVCRITSTLRQDEDLQEVRQKVAYLIRKDKHYQIGALRATPRRRSSSSCSPQQKRSRLRVSSRPRALHYPP